MLIVFGHNFLNAQTNDDEGTKIDLNNVNVQVKALPTIFLFGQQYTFRERDNFIRGILKSKWFLKDLSISLDLEEFYTLYADQGDSDNSWKVSVDDLDQNTFDLSPKNPNRVEEVDTRTPAEIIAEIEELDQQAAEALKVIKELL